MIVIRTFNEVQNPWVLQKMPGNCKPKFPAGSKIKINSSYSYLRRDPSNERVDSQEQLVTSFISNFQKSKSRDSIGSNQASAKGSIKKSLMLNESTESLNLIN